jgi:CheY-like chemotaxis protein
MDADKYRGGDALNAVAGSTMSLPHREESGAAPAPNAVSNPPQPRKVLVVDDCQDARSILQLLLTKLGHQAKTAEDARTGIAISRDFQPEIVFCDLMMAGGMSGYAFARAAREEQKLAGVCIVAVSGWDGPEYERQAYDAGFDQLLKKPVGLSDLQQVLQSPPRRAGRPAPSAIDDQNADQN